MKRIVCGLLAVLLLAGCSKRDADETAAPEAKPETPWKVTSNTNGEPVVTLDTETQQRIGLQVAPIELTEMRAETKAYGRVLDPAALVGAVTEFESARAAAKASGEEFQRLKNLAAQDNASARALQAAEATATRDELAANAARTKLALAWGGAVANREDLPAFAKSLATGEAELARIDLPAGDTLPAQPLRAQLALAANETNSVEAEFLDVAPGVDPQTQGRGYFFLAKSAHLPVDAALTAYLVLPSQPVAAAVVPRDAILRYDGATWVFLQTGETEFTRHRVILERPAPDGWFVRERFGSGEKVVTVGAQTLLSTELSARGFQSGERE